MRFFLLSAVLIVAAACTTTDVAVAPPTAEDLTVVDTLRELDEQGTVLLGAAKSRASHKELSDFADEAIHEHEKRSDRIRAWRSASFSTAARQISLPSCAERGFSPASTGATDIQVLDGFIAHHECAIRFAREAGTRLSSSDATSIVGEILRTYERELEQFRKWRAAWQ